MMVDKDTHSRALKHAAIALILCLELSDKKFTSAEELEAEIYKRANNDVQEALAISMMMKSFMQDATK